MYFLLWNIISCSRSRNYRKPCFDHIYDIHVLSAMVLNSS